MWDRITVRSPRNSLIASRTHRPGEYFRRFVVAKSSEQSSEQSEDNSGDISRKDLDDHEPGSCRREHDGKPLDSERCGRGLATESPKKSQEKRKASFPSESATKRHKRWS